MSKEAFPAQWGRVRVFEAQPPGPDDEGEWSLPWWRSLVFPNAGGEIHHGSRGATLPDTLVVRYEAEQVALADVFSYVLENQYCYDAEYFLVLRVRAVLDHERWEQLPWGHLQPGEVFCAYDKFHHHEYLRTPGDETPMSYGGSWSDLQELLDSDQPTEHGRREATPVSNATLLRAVRAGEAARVRELLARGADPDAGSIAPDAALRAVSFDRDSYALWEAIMQGSIEMTEALLSAGASVEGPGRGRTPLHGALVNGKLALVPLLLRHGADPMAVFDGKTALEVAEALGSEVAVLFDPARRSG